MSKRTTITVELDDELLAAAAAVAKKDAPADVVEHALTELVRRDSLHRIADLLGTDDTMVAAPRRRRPADETGD